LWKIHKKLRSTSTWFPIRYNFVSEKSSADRPTKSTTNVNHIGEVDFIVPRDEMIHDRSMSYLSSVESLIKLDNVWLATIAGSIF